MIKINRTTISVLIFFIVVFSIFLYLKPEITGMVTANTLTPNQTIYLNNTILGGSITLNFGAGDSIPFDSKVDLIIMNITSEGDSAGIKIASQKTITTIFGSNSPPTNTTGVTTDKDSIDLPWEQKQIQTYNFSYSQQYQIKLEDFNFKVPDIAQLTPQTTYNVILNISWDCPAGTRLADGITDAGCPILYNVSTYRTQIAVRNNIAPSINNINLVNSNGSNIFRVGNYINCSATITDANEDTPIIKAVFWGPSKTQSGPSKRVDGETNKCTGISWSSGKNCQISTKIESIDITKNTDLGYWNCSINVSDGYSINFSLNSSNVFSMNNTPIIFVGKLNNESWYNDTSRDTDYPIITSDINGNGFYDPDSIINITPVGNTSINVTIGSDYKVNFIGKSKNFTGIVKMFFNATDIYSSARSNNITLNVSKRSITSCTANWSCSDWTTCTNNLQFKTCTDTNQCNSSQLTKLENQTCTISQTTGGSGSTESPTSPGTGTSGASSSSGSTNQSQKAASAGASSSATTQKIIISLGIILGIIGLSAGGYFLYRYYSTKEEKSIFEVPTEKPKEIKQEKIEFKSTIEAKPITIANLDELKKYIQTAFKNKVPIQKIKEDLLKAGWKEKQIQDELNLVSLKNFIQVKINQGMKKEDVVSMLKLKGWREDQIEEAFIGVSEKPLI